MVETPEYEKVSSGVSSPIAEPAPEKDQSPIVEAEPEAVPVIEVIPKEEPVKEEEKPANVLTPIILSPLPVYPAYIKDQCGALWGIPATLQGEYDKVLIQVATSDGIAIPQSELDVFSIDGVLYLIRRYWSTDSKGKPTEAIDYYRQKANEIERVDSVPEKPVEGRITFSGISWLIETSIINGVEFSYLYNLDPSIISAQGNYGGKGAYMGAWGMISSAVELDKGILVMTRDGSRFFPQNRACGNPVSEYGRMWK